MSMKENVLFSVADHPTPKVDDSGIGYTLNSRDYKDAQCVVLENYPSDSKVICENISDMSSQIGTEADNVPMVTGNTYCVGNGQLAQAKLSYKVGTLNCMHDQQAILTKSNLDGLQVAGTLDASYYKGCGERNGVEREVVCSECESEQNMIVRRLTPLECTRLQGYPDGWVDIGEWTDSKGKKHKDADAPKYKALGNSIALPFWQWMADRMVEQLRADGVENPTMASLFDGIGGFPLVYSRCGCKPVWASEIEEFPIAVTKKHFGDEDSGEHGNID